MDGGPVFGGAFLISRTDRLRSLTGRREEKLMLEGLMQHDHPLTLQHVLWRLRSMNGGGTVTTLNGTDEPDRISYDELAERVDRLANALKEMGIKSGDRVASFAWNTQRHLELYLAAPCMGA